jgi:hypothetical protein
VKKSRFRKIVERKDWRFEIRPKKKEKKKGEEELSIEVPLLVAA